MTDERTLAYWKAKAEQYRERLEAESRERQRLSAMLAEVAAIAAEQTRDLAYHHQRLTRVVGP
jgi:hypothetical protein